MIHLENLPGISSLIPPGVFLCDSLRVPAELPGFLLGLFLRQTTRGGAEDFRGSCGHSRRSKRLHMGFHERLFYRVMRFQERSSSVSGSFKGT